MTWLDELIKQHEELEPPKSFWYWSGLCAISAIVKDNVWTLEGGAWNLYPNIYVILYADSGVGKGPPIALAHNLVKRVNNTKIISGRSSIQGILTKLSKTQSKPGGKIDKTSTGFIVASEFSSALVHDPAAMDILTDLFDRHWRIGEWESLLKQEQFNLITPTVSLLAGINEAHFENLLENKDVFGGFLGRSFLVREKRSSLLNPLIDDLKNKPNPEKLVEYLHKLAGVKGAFESLEKTEAGELYKEWYMEFYQKVMDEDIEDKTGSISRARDGIKKVSMLLSLSESPDLIIKVHHVREAIEVCERLVSNIQQTTRGRKGMSSMAAHKALILTELLERPNHEITRTVLAKKYWMHFSTEELDEIMKDFETAGMIRASSRGNQVVYTMPERQVIELRDFLKRKGSK